MRSSAGPQVLAEVEDELRRIGQAALKLRLRVAHQTTGDDEGEDPFGKNSGENA